MTRAKSRRAALLVTTVIATVHAITTFAADGVPPSERIFTVAGSGPPGDVRRAGGDGGPATSAKLLTPRDVSATADGGFLIADTADHSIRSVGRHGRISTVAGTGSAPGGVGGGLRGDGGPATQASVNSPDGVAANPRGGFLIADTGNHRVRAVSPTGTITTVAGSGPEGGPGGFAGDGGPATQARLLGPRGVAATSDGGLLVADSGNNRVRRVSPSGTIETVAGNGSDQTSGDGGPATAAGLYPADIALTAEGGLLIADAKNARVRYVTASGTITTVAGSGIAAFSGDGGPATEARLNAPQDVAPTRDGGFLIADARNLRIRHVASSGSITTVAGRGRVGAFGGDGGLARLARLDFPTAIAATQAGFLISELVNQRVRFVESSTAGAASPVSGVPLTRLATAFAGESFTRTATRPIHISYVATRRATARLDLRREGRVVSKAKLRAKRGFNRLTLAALAAGRYRLGLLLRSRDGQVTTDIAGLRVR